MVKNISTIIKKLVRFPLKGNHWIWLQTNEIVTFYPKEKKLILYDFEYNPIRTEQVDYTPFHVSTEGIIYAHTYNKATHAIELYACKNGDCKKTNQLSLQKDDIYPTRWHFRFDERNNRFLAFNSLEMHREVYIIDQTTGQIYDSTLEADKSFLCDDRNGMIWVVYKEGLALIQFKQTPFHHYKDIVNSRGIWANDKKVVVASSHVNGWYF